MEKRENVTIWERKNTDRFEFQCHNESEPIFWKQCNRTDEVCENDQCVTNEEEYFAVKIDIEGIDLTYLNRTEVL